jgi:hypothetical protein
MMHWCVPGEGGGDRRKVGEDRAEKEERRKGRGRCTFIYLSVKNI